MQIQLVTVPYRYDERGEGQGAGPAALLDAGLVERLAIDHTVLPATEAALDAALREDGRTAVNIGKLGADTARLVAEARTSGNGVLVLSGDDTAAVGIVAGLQRSAIANGPVGIVWLDAHGDFNTPETSFSGILAGMPLAIIAGLAGPLWREAAGLSAPIPTDRMLVAGVRDLDEKEEQLLRSTAIKLVTADEIRGGSRFADLLGKLSSHCSSLLLHIDLDVLDPDLVPSSSTPSANGLTIAEVVELIHAVLATGKVAAVSIASLNPGGGARGQRSIQSTLSVIEQGLKTWKATPTA